MAEMGVGINDEMLSAVGAADVYLRSCANLANQQYRLGTALCRAASSNCSKDTHLNDSQCYCVPEYGGSPVSQRYCQATAHCWPTAGSPIP